MGKRIYQIFAGNKHNLFNQIKDNVDYFKKLGVNTIWLTPFHESGSYHGYDVVGYLSIKPSIGTMKEFELMCKVLELHGIEVMMDLVLCHTSDKHMWFENFPRWYVWSDSKGERINHNNNSDQSSMNENVWHEKDGKYYFAPFDGSMPSLNLDTELVRMGITSIVNFWKNAGVSHFRLDAVIHAYAKDNIEFWSWFKSICGDSFIVGEAWSDLETIKRYNNALGSCFDFPVYYNILDNAHEHGIAKVGESLRYSPLSLTRFSSNHDTNRLATTLGYDVERIKLALAINLLSSDNNCLYYGDELAMGGIKEERGDACVRGKWDIDEIETHMDIDGSVLNEYIRLVELIESNEVLKYGKIEWIQEHYHYNKFDVVWVYGDKRVKVKFQRSAQCLDKEYVVATYCGIDIVIKGCE